ncbi:hypothetical protein [uncultured Psychroserpens sp.]|uniref:hypothetical protein n=1 Tax=uncultured Psychroserpens sp. TaxID=255436 RepID=UPI0026379DC7|nr:hypothetical protein [uncultured Psychroserpens sp.]
MKTKKKTYVLLVLVLGVWGTIVYKIITGLNPELPELNIQQVIAIKDFKVDTKVDTFSIATVDRDPFLGTITKKKTKLSVAKKRKSITWLPIVYLGIVKNKNQREQVFIVSINGKQSLLKQGQSKDSVALLGGNKNSVTFRYKNEQRTFLRKTD